MALVKSWAKAKSKSIWRTAKKETIDTKNIIIATGSVVKSDSGF